MVTSSPKSTKSYQDKQKLFRRKSLPNRPRHYCTRQDEGRVESRCSCGRSLSLESSQSNIVLAVDSDNSIEEVWLSRGVFDLFYVSGCGCKQKKLKIVCRKTRFEK